MFLPYMGIAAILFKDAEPFEQSVNIPLTDGHMKSGENWSSGFRDEEVKDFMVLYLYIVQGQG